MKRFVVVCFCVLLLISLSGCRKKSQQISADDTSEAKRHLTIYSIRDNESVSEAVYDYNLSHSDVSINYEVGLTENSEGLTKSDLIRTVNTKLLAGKGADILLLDDLPVTSYIEKGILMDMSDIFQEPIKTEEILKNIAESYIDQDKIYCMPLRFYVPFYIMGNDVTSHTKSMCDLAAYCQKSDHKLMEPISYNQLSSIFLFTYWNELVNEDGGMDNQNIQSFLSNISEIAKQTDAKMAIEHEETEADPICDIWNAKLKVDIDTIITAGNDLGIDISYNFIDLAVKDYFIKQENGKLASINESFIPNGLVAINRRTKEVELAKDFVTSLYSDWNQSQNETEGYSMNCKALMKESVDREHTRIVWDVPNKEGVWTSVKMKPLTMEEKQKAVELFKTLKRPIYSDYDKMDIIVDGAVEYLSGKKGLEDEVSMIQNKMKLVLEE